jgi:hypothetical protein
MPHPADSYHPPDVLLTVAGNGKSINQKRIMAGPDNIVVMDGPGPFFFGRLEGPLKLMPALRADAVAIEGEMEVDETGRRVTVCVPLSNADAIQLWKLLGNYKRDHDLPDPDPADAPLKQRSRCHDRGRQGVAVERYILRSTSHV